MNSRLINQILPAIEIKDTSKMSITREIVDVSDEEVEEQVKRVASLAETFETKKGKAEAGDRVTMDYLGKVDGVPFDGGADSDATLVLGSGQFIPGFEDQLIGVKAGDEKQIKVTFPAEYQAADLAGKDATFDITVKEVAKPGELEINDETAKKLGIESADRLRQVIREADREPIRFFHTPESEASDSGCAGWRIPVRVARASDQRRVQQYLGSDRSGPCTGWQDL